METISELLELKEDTLKEVNPFIVLQKNLSLSILLLSLLLYFISLLNLNNYNHTHGGGQQTLPGMDVVVFFIVSIVLFVFSILQFFYYRRIAKKSTESLLIILIAIPFIFVNHFFLSSYEIPDAYLYTVSILFSLCIISIYTALKLALKPLFYACVILGCLLVVSSVVLYILSLNNSRWWDNGSHIEVIGEQGRKTEYIEKKKMGIIYGEHIQWNYDGELDFYSRYPNGSNNKPDSVVEYSVGKISKMRYTFDSANAVYQRQRVYDLNTNDSMYCMVFIESLRNMQTLDISKKEWWRVTKQLYINQYSFDSVAKKYLRTTQYNKNGTIYSNRVYEYKPRLSNEKYDNDDLY